jgi:hypothetical protein
VNGRFLPEVFACRPYVKEVYMCKVKVDEQFSEDLQVN